jgi:hypothetical protein
MSTMSPKKKQRRSKNMSDMKPTGLKIRLGQKEYGLRFTLNAIDDIQEKFEIDIADLGDLFKDGMKQIKNLRAVLAILINEDIDCLNDETGSLQLHIDERYVGRHIDASNIQYFSSQIFGAFMKQAPKVEDDDPNPVSGQPNH